MKKKIIIGLSIVVTAIVVMLVLFGQFWLLPSEPTSEQLYFWGEVSEAKLIVYISNEGDDVVILRRVILPDYGVTTPLMELARIQPDTTLPYLLIQNDPILCEQIASEEYLLIRIVTEKGTYEN